MIFTITRVLARQLRSVLRRAGFAKLAKAAVLFHSDADGLRLQAIGNRIAIEYHIPGHWQAGRFALPFEFLADCEGAKPEAVSLDVQPDRQIRVSWFDRRIPKAVQYKDCQGDIQEAFPALPATMAENDETFLPALVAAMETGDPTSTRYALDTVQLMAPVGEMAATDTMQLLLQSGFQFPWEGELLLPSSPVFKAPELLSAGSVQIGRCEKHVTLRMGPWTIHLHLEQDRRFPKLRDIVFAPAAAQTHFHIDQADAEFLKEALPQLPGDMAFNWSVTVVCHRELLVRAKAEGQEQVTELLLSRSKVEGEPIGIQMNRRFLERALRLGFREFHLAGTTVLGRDERRNYIWQTLGTETDLATEDNVVRIISDSQPAPASLPPAVLSATSTARSFTAAIEPVPTPPQIPAIPNRIPERTETMSQRPTNGHTPNRFEETTPANGQSPNSTASNGASSETNGQEVFDPIVEAEALKEHLRQTLEQTNRLLSALRRHKKQARLVASTLASLRQLQSVG